MATNLGGITLGEDGRVGRSGSGTPAETNVAVWAPALPRAFENARDATWFTRIGTRHVSQEVKAALEATPDVDQTFCLSVNNAILVFTAGSQDEHVAQVRKVLQMLLDHSMSADIKESVFDVAKSTDAGIRLEQVGEHKVYMVINQGVPGR